MARDLGQIRAPGVRAVARDQERRHPRPVGVQAGRSRAFTVAASAVMSCAFSTTGTDSACSCVVIPANALVSSKPCSRIACGPAAAKARRDSTTAATEWVCTTQPIRGSSP